MALPLWVPVTVEELYDELDLDEQKVRLKQRCERLLRRATAIVERATHRKLIYRAAPYTEFHTVPPYTPAFFTLQYPILSSPAVQIYEDPNRVYDASTLLAPADFEVFPGDAEGLTRAKITRAFDWWWLSGPRYIKLLYPAGFLDRSAVPDDIKDVILNLSALAFRQIERKAQGEVQSKDQSGATLKFLDRSLTTVHLSAEMRDQLQPYVREDHVPTGEAVA